MYQLISLSYDAARRNADSPGEKLVGHRQEPRSSTLLDRCYKLSILGDVAVTIEQVRSRHSNIVEGEFCIVDTVEAHLVAHVFYGDTGNRLKVMIFTLRFNYYVA